MRTKPNEGDTSTNATGRVRLIDEDFLMENICKMTYNELADHFGVQPGAIKQFISRLRSKGYELPYRKWKNPGDLCYRKRNGAVYEYKKLEDGSWKYIRTVTPKPKQNKQPVRPAKNLPNRIVKKAATKKIRTDGRRMPKRSEKRFETRKQDMSNMEWVKRDHKTYVLRVKSKVAI